jgi:hypothetical protein
VGRRARASARARRLRRGASTRHLGGLGADGPSVSGSCEHMFA